MLRESLRPANTSDDAAPLEVDGRATPGSQHGYVKKMASDDGEIRPKLMELRTIYEPSCDEEEDVVLEEDLDELQMNDRFMALTRVHTERTFSHASFFGTMRSAWNLA